MSYDIAAWQGTRPGDDAAGLDAFEVEVDRLDEQPDAPVAAAVEGFVAELVQRYPDGADDHDSPWATAPLLTGAAGGGVYLSLVVVDRLDEVVDFVGRTAERHGLVCFDPQTEVLLPER